MRHEHEYQGEPSAISESLDYTRSSEMLRAARPLGSKKALAGRLHYVRRRLNQRGQDGLDGANNDIGQGGDGDDEDEFTSRV